MFNMKVIQPARLDPETKFKFRCHFDIDEEKIKKLKDDEISLMRFGFKYLKYLFMMEETLKVKSEALEAKNAKK